MKIYKRICPGCEQEFESKRIDKMTCSNACHKRIAWRKKNNLPISGSLDAHRQARPKDPKPCEHCGKMYIPFRKRSRFCSNLCSAQWHYKRKNTVQRERPCKECQSIFSYNGIGHLNFCSDKCARIAASRSKIISARTAAQWRKDHPNETAKYRKVQKERNPESVKGGLTQRFFAKYPHVKYQCQSCGEKRIVELAHKIARNGAWRTLGNTTEKDVWILCPTCHRLLDFGICTKEQLNLIL